MAGNNANVSSVALSELQLDLKNLSNSLHDLYDTMNADMSNVKEFWQDQKYQDFVSGYKPQLDKCEEISQRYSRWCSSVLQEAIDKVVKIENANVGGDGSSVSAASAGSATGASAVGAAASGMAASKPRDFNNMGEAIGKVQRKEGANKIVNTLNNKPLTEADKKCQDIQPGSRARIVGKGEAPDVEWTEEISQTAASAERSTKAGAGIDIAGVKLGSDIELKENSPINSVKTTTTKRVKCEMPDPKHIVKDM